MDKKGEEKLPRNYFGILISDWRGLKWLERLRLRRLRGNLSSR